MREPGGRRRPRGRVGSPAMRPRRQNGAGSPGGRGGGRWRSAFPAPPPCPLRVPLPVFPAGGWRRGHLPAAPLWRACLCPLVSALPSPAFPADGGSRACGGARARAAAAAFVLGAGPSRSPRPHGALGASRDARRGGGPPWRLPGAGSGPPPHPRGASEPSAHAGRPPAAASRRPPWTVLSRFPSGVCSAPAVHPLRVSPLRAPPPRPGLGPGFGSSPSPPLLSPPRFARPACPCPASRCSPLALCGERGLGSRVRGGTRLWGKARALGGAWEGRGVRPAPGGSGVGGGGGMGRGRCRVSASGAGGGARRGVGGPPPSRAGSVGDSAPPRGWPRMGSASRRGGLWPRVPPPASPVPPPPVQVPSASRRGGLKTLWGSPVRLGSGRSGPWGGGFPSPPDSAAHRTPGAGVAAPRHGLCAAVGRGLPGGPVGPCVCVCPACLGGCGGVGGNPLGACGVVRASPLAWGGAVAGCPVVQPFRPSRSLVSLVSDWPAGGTPLGECAVPGGGAPPGVGPLNDQNSYDS